MLYTTQRNNYCLTVPMPGFSKKQGGLFDMTMGMCDGAELFKLVRIYMLNVLFKKYNKNNFGLYRDGGLAALKNKSGSQSRKDKEKRLENI